MINRAAAVVLHYFSRLPHPAPPASKQLTTRDSRVTTGFQHTKKINILTFSSRQNFMAYSFISNPAIIVVVDLLHKKKKKKILVTKDIRADRYICL